VPGLEVALDDALDAVERAEVPPALVTERRRCFAVPAAVPVAGAGSR
jgi:hypothetical protein